MELTSRQREIFNFRQNIYQRERLSPFCKGDRRTLQYLSPGGLRPPQGIGEKRLFEAAGFDVERS